MKRYRSLTERLLRFCIAGLAVILIAGVAVLFARGGGRPVAAPLSATEAIAVDRTGSEASRTDVIERLQTLFAAQAYDAVIEEAGRRAIDDPAIDVYAAESLLRTARYQQAFDAALALEEKTNDHPRSMLLAARAAYALGDRQFSVDRLAKVLRAAPDTTAAWLLRARLALDAGEEDVFRSALIRASEAGAAGAVIEALEIEAAMRNGAFDDAARRLSARRARNAAADPAVLRDPAAQRLNALLLAMRGDTVAANRLLNAIDDAPADDPRLPLVKAFVKAALGDDALADAALSEALDAAPSDWVRLDFAAAYYINRQKTDQADAVIRKLSGVRPTLAAARAYEASREARDFDRAHAAMRNAPTIDAAFRTGADVVFGVAGNPMSARGVDALKRVRRLISGEVVEGTGADHDVDRAVAAVRKAEIAFEDGAFARARALVGDAMDTAPYFERAFAVYVAAGVADGAFDEVAARVSKFEPSQEAGIDVDLVRARLWAAQDQSPRAAALLTHHEPDLLDRRRDALFYAALLKAEGEEQALFGFLDAARRAGPSSSAAAPLLLRYGAEASAAAVARAALLARPGRPDAACDYAAAMIAAGREAEAVGLLEKVAREAPRADNAKAALAWLGFHEGAECDPASASNISGDQRLRLDLAPPPAHRRARERLSCFWSGDLCAPSENRDS